MTEQEAYDTLFSVLNDSKEAHYEAVANAARPIDWTKIPKIYDVKGFATLAKDLTIRSPGSCRERVWKAGTRVRITLASCMGDLGITNDLELRKYHSYLTRVMPGDGYLKDIEVCL